MKFIRLIMPFLLSFLIFLILFHIAINLPVLGDGANHAWIIEEIADKQSLCIESKVYYPMLYHLFGSIVYIFLGINGIKLLSPLMMALSGLLVYIIVNKLIKSEFVALLSVTLIAFSPKIIWYGVQILMEPFMIFFILLTIYVCILFYKNQKLRFSLLFSLMLGVAISTKQQALFLIISLPIFLLIHKKTTYKKVFMIAAMSLLIAFGPWFYMYSTTGCLAPPPSDSVILHLKDEVLPSILFKNYKIPEWSEKLEKESNGFELYQKGTIMHESRHIYIWDFVNVDKFYFLYGLYPKMWYGISSKWKESINYLALKWLFLLGIIILVYYIFKNLRKDKDTNTILCLLFYISLVSGFFMYLGSDTKRYFLYLSILFSFCYILPIYTFLIYLGKKRTIFNKFIVFSIIFMVVVAIIPYSVSMEAINGSKRLKNTQAYTPSKGGIASIKEVGRWIQNNSAINDKIYGTSAYEWRYYTKRKVIFDFRIYFLSESRIDYWLKYWGIKYIIIRQNQIVPDEKWKHIEFFPESFYKKIKDKYPMVYKSSKGDIEVYKVR